MFLFVRTYVGQHVRHCGDDPLRAVEGFCVFLVRDVVVVYAASVLAVSILRFLVLKQLGLIHLQKSTRKGVHGRRSVVASCPTEQRAVCAWTRRAPSVC